MKTRGSGKAQSGSEKSEKEESWLWRKGTIRLAVSDGETGWRGGDA